MDLEIIFEDQELPKKSGKMNSSKRNPVHVPAYSYSKCKNHRSRTDMRKLTYRKLPEVPIPSRVQTELRNNAQSANYNTVKNCASSKDSSSLDVEDLPKKSNSLKKVHFNDSNLVQLNIFEDDDNNNCDTKYIDNCRFRDRIFEAEETFSRILMDDYRQHIYTQRFCQFFQSEH